jgi:excisionase family DNA binding protein
MSASQRDLTLAEVAELRRFTPGYLCELIRRHQIPVLRSGRLIRFDALSLSALEEAL